MYHLYFYDIYLKIGWNKMKNKNPSLSDKITEKLREQIIYGSWEPGKIITVREIAQKYNVSTTPVRDAVNRLALVMFGKTQKSGHVKTV